MAPTSDRMRADTGFTGFMALLPGAVAVHTSG